MAVSTEEKPTHGHVSRRDRWLPIAAASSIVLAGTSLAIYALFAFVNPDWTVAGPGILVALAGVAGVRERWLLLAGLVPMGAILSVAGPILAFDLARPGETPYFVGTVAVIVGGCLAAILGLAAAVDARPRRALLTVVLAAVSVPVVILSVVAANPGSADLSEDISDAERAAATDVELADFAFGVDPADLEAGQVLRLHNTGSLPHDFTVDSLDLAAFVPSGRDTYIRLPESTPASFRVICTVGDHLEQGMLVDVGGATG